MKTSNVLLGILAGVAAGALIGILVAPDKGSRTDESPRMIRSFTGHFSAPNFSVSLFFVRPFSCGSRISWSYPCASVAVYLARVDGRSKSSNAEFVRMPAAPYFFRNSWTSR